MLKQDLSLFISFMSVIFELLLSYIRIYAIYILSVQLSYEYYGIFARQEL